MNMNSFGPKLGIINGSIGNWELDLTDLKPTENIDSIYDSTKKEMIAGDFRKLVDFLIKSTGKTEKSL